MKFIFERFNYNWLGEGGARIEEVRSIIENRLTKGEKEKKTDGVMNPKKWENVHGKNVTVAMCAV